MWRHGARSIRSGAVRIGGSPFKTFAEAQEACNTMLEHLNRDR
jgi:hypothetical protein